MTCSPHSARSPGGPTRKKERLPKRWGLFKVSHLICFLHSKQAVWESKMNSQRPQEWEGQGMSSQPALVTE